MTKVKQLDKKVPEFSALVSLDRHIVKGLELDEALEKVLTEYQEEEAKKGHVLDSQLVQAIDGFIRRLRMVCVGNIFLGFKFDETLSKEIADLFRCAALREQAIMRAPSTLVRDCEIEMVREGNTAKVIFEQTVRLEEAFVSGKTKRRHEREVEDELEALIERLYEKFAELILCAKETDAFYKMVGDAFSLDKMDDFANKFHIQGFVKEVQAQIRYLSHTGFLNDFFKHDDLAEKYDHVSDFYWKERNEELLGERFEKTLRALSSKIVKEAFSPCVHEKFRLMEQQGMVIDNVYVSLDKWKEKKWAPYQDTILLEALEQKYQNEKQYYYGWQKVHEQVGCASNGKRPRVLWMYQAHCMRYCEDPFDNPEEILKRGKQVKQAEQERQKVLEHLIPTSLVCPEVLVEDPISDDEIMENQENRNSRVFGRRSRNRVA